MLSCRWLLPALATVVSDARFILLLGGRTAATLELVKLSGPVNMNSGVDGRAEDRTPWAGVKG